MIRNTLIIGGASFVLMVFCFFGVAALAGPEIMSKGWTLPFYEDNVVVKVNGREVVTGQRTTPKGRPASPDTVRQIDWTGKDTLTIDLPVDVTFIQGPVGKIEAQGPKDYIERLQVDGGRITLDRDDPYDHDRLTIDRRGMRIESDSDRVRITVTAPNVRRFEIQGSGDLEIRRFDLPNFDLAISGSGDAQVKGRAQNITLDSSGSGYADLGDLKGQDATVSVSGSGGGVLFAMGKAKINISGSGAIGLKTEPRSVSSEITGSGDVHREY